MDIVEYLREIINKPIKGLPLHDSDGSKNLDKAVLLSKSGFKFDQKSDLFRKGNLEISVQEMGNTTFSGIVDIALNK